MVFAWRREAQPVTIYLVRHGQAVQNVEDHIGGYKIDTPLTEKGEEQARRRSQSFEGIHFTAAYSSDLQRAYQTTRIILDMLGQQLPIHKRRGLRERNLGIKAENRHNPQVRQDFQADIRQSLAKGKIDRRPLNQVDNVRLVPGEETERHMRRRVRREIRFIARHNPNGKILVGTHGGTLRMILMELGYAQRGELPSGSVDNTAYIVLQTNDKGKFFDVVETHGIRRRILSPEVTQGERVAAFYLPPQN